MMASSQSNGAACALDRTDSTLCTNAMYGVEPSIAVCSCWGKLEAGIATSVRRVINFVDHPSGEFIEQQCRHLLAPSRLTNHCSCVSIHIFYCYCVGGSWSSLLMSIRYHTCVDPGMSAEDLVLRYLNAVRSLKTALECSGAVCAFNSDLLIGLTCCEQVLGLHD